VRFLRGAAEALPVEDGIAELVWCRDVLVHVVDLERAYREFHRVLRDSGGRGSSTGPACTEPRSRRRACEWTSGRADERVG
jgi:ubiquinone/menaquinone biosynthesis C-methylase UbiE